MRSGDVCGNPPTPWDEALVAELAAKGVHSVSDGYSVTECSRGLGPDRCGLQVVRPGSVQCWCDDQNPNSPAYAYDDLDALQAETLENDRMAKP